MEPEAAGGRCCYGYFVPDREAQRQLAELGFDLDAPKRSWDTRQPATCFGGAHVSVLKRREFSPDCLEQLRVAAGCTRHWRAPAMSLREGWQAKPQATVDFRCSQLRAAASAAKEAGWPDVNQDKYHVGLYNSTLEQKLSPEYAAAMIDCLQHAGWGWVLSIDDGNELFKFDWETFIPCTPATFPGLQTAALANAQSRTHLHTRQSFETLTNKWEVFQMFANPSDVGSRWRFRPVWLGAETRRRGETSVLIETERRKPTSGDVRYLHVRKSWMGLVDSGKEREVLQLSPVGGPDIGSRWGVVQFEDGTVALRSHRADWYLQWVDGPQKWQVFKLHWDISERGCRWQLVP